MAGGVIGLIPYARVTGDELVDLAIRDSVAREHPVVADRVRKALTHRGVDMTTVLSERDFLFGTQVALREHWRALHGEVDSWDAHARAHGTDPRPLQEAVQ